MHSRRTIAYFLAYAQQSPLYLERSYLGFLPDWPPMTHTWTLAVEEQFYLIWPALLLAVGRHRVVWLSAAMLLGSVAARFLGFPDSLLVARCDGLALGALLAGLERRGYSTRGRPALGAGLALWIAVACVYDGPGGGRPPGSRAAAMMSLRYFATALTFYGVVASVAMRARTGGGALTAWLRARPLVYLGTISYGIYLYHLPLIQLYFEVLRPGVRGLWRIPPPITVAAMSIAVAAVSWRFIEEPILRLKDRFPYTAEPRAEPEMVALIEETTRLDASLTTASASASTARSTK
jgi:peptidoglycan/LPS O-acetylase OafA/YrhL